MTAVTRGDDVRDVHVRIEKAVAEEAISRDVVRQRLHRAHLGMRGHLVDFAAQVRETANKDAGGSKRSEGGRP